MYSLQNRTKHEVWREMGHGNNHALDCSRELPWVPLMWPVITRMRAPHGCWKSTPRFASQFGFPMRTPQHPTTQMPKWCQSDAKWCQMPRPPKITLPAEHMRIKADSVTSATLPSLFICSLRAVQTLSDLCSVISAQNWPILTHPGTLITAFEIPLWPWWSSTNAALHSDEETFTIENNSALGDHLTSYSPHPDP